MAENLDEKQNFLIGGIGKTSIRLFANLYIKPCLLALAAILEAIILQPTLYWKNARAQRLPFSFDPRIIYRGSTISILNECQLMGLQFGCTSYFQQVFGRHMDKDEPWHHQQQLMLASIAGGFLSALSASPAELVRAIS